jgi:hypothetical protein
MFRCSGKNFKHNKGYSMFPAYSFSTEDTKYITNSKDLYEKLSTTLEEYK